MTQFKLSKLIPIFGIDASLVVRESNHGYSDKSAPSKHSRLITDFVNSQRFVSLESFVITDNLEREQTIGW